jgi:hypothetical protein
MEYRTHTQNLWSLIMKTLKPLAAAALLAALPLGAFAAESTLSYNFIEGGYAKATQRDGDSNDFDYDGFYGAGSGKVTKNVYVFGDYRQLTSDTFAGARVRVDSALAGVGLIIPVTKIVDLNVNGGGVWEKYKYQGTAANFTPHDNDDTGFFVGGGARADFAAARSQRRLSLQQGVRRQRNHWPGGRGVQRHAGAGSHWQLRVRRPLQPVPDWRALQLRYLIAHALPHFSFAGAQKSRNAELLGCSKP